MPTTNRALAAIAVLTLLILADAQASQAASCAQTAFGGNLNCTAGDTGVAQITAINVTDPCTGVGDTATIQLRLRIVSTANNRYDIGYYVALDGGDAYTGDCFNGILTPVSATPDPASGVGPYLNSDGDGCGDIAQDVDNLVDLPPLNFSCTDADANGQLDISTVVSWTQSAMDVCNAAPALPGNSSKCEGSVFASINVPVPTATPTSTPSSTPSATPSSTRTGTATSTSTATATATATNTAVNTATNTSTATYTPVSTATSTHTSTNTPVNTATSTATSTATPTNTPVDTATSTATSTATPTNTPVDTATSTATSTNTPVDTATSTPSSTATPSNTPVDTATSTATATNTPSFTATPSNTPVDTATGTATATNTPQSAPEPPTPTSTSTSTSTSTNTPTSTPTASATETFEESTPVQQQAPNIDLNKTFPGLCRPNGTTTMILAVRNIGDAPTSGPITVDDPLPAGLTFVQATGSNWDCAGSTLTQITCVRDAILNAGATAAPINVTLSVAGDAAAVLLNTAVATTPGDLDEADGTASAFCRRNPVPAPAASPTTLAAGLLLLVGIAGLAIRRRRSRG